MVLRAYLWLHIQDSVLSLLGNLMVGIETQLAVFQAGPLPIALSLWPKKHIKPARNRA